MQPACSRRQGQGAGLDPYALRRVRYIPSVIKAALIKVLRQWPLSALLAWTGAWLTYLALFQTGAPLWFSMSSGVMLGAGLALLESTRTRRLIVALGFPLSLMASGLAAGLPAWAWLLPLALLVLVYPRHAWRDAPWFPTPANALDALSRLAPLKPGAAVLDAGCGLGHGLRALRRAYPDARLEGVEHSALLALWTRLSCSWALVRQGDMWGMSWAPFDLVYLFQRPESMVRAWDKAKAELAAGAWLVSLEFEITEVSATAEFQTPNGKTVRLYQVPKPDLR